MSAQIGALTSASPLGLNPFIIKDRDIPCGEIPPNLGSIKRHLDVHDGGIEENIEQGDYVKFAKYVLENSFNPPPNRTVNLFRKIIIALSRIVEQPENGATRSAIRASRKVAHRIFCGALNALLDEALFNEGKIQKKLESISNEMMFMTWQDCYTKKIKLIRFEVEEPQAPVNSVADPAA